MIKKLLCLLWGHQMVRKAYTGETVNVTGPLGNKYTISMYRYKRLPFCIRCGKEITHE